MKDKLFLQLTMPILSLTDAELIHILDIPKETAFTEITSTTIENLTHRKSLLKLEGGEEAFKKRDKKLLSSV